MTADSQDEVEAATKDFAATILRYMTGVGTDHDAWDALSHLTNVLADHNDPKRAKVIFARALRLETPHSKNFKGDEIDRYREMIAMHGIRLMANKFQHNWTRWHSAVAGMSEYITLLVERRAKNRARLASGRSISSRDRNIDL